MSGFDVDKYIITLVYAIMIRKGTIGSYYGAPNCKRRKYIWEHSFILLATVLFTVVAPW